MVFPLSWIVGILSLTFIVLKPKTNGVKCGAIIIDGCFAIMFNKTLKAANNPDRLYKSANGMIIVTTTSIKV